MFAYAAIPLTCWLCALLALPRRPRPGNEIAELVYARLLGRQQRLLLLAVAVTAATFLAVVLSLPQRIDARPDDARSAQWTLTHSAAGFPVRYRLQPDGRCVRDELQDDGTWVTATSAPADACAG